MTMTDEQKRQLEDLTRQIQRRVGAAADSVYGFETATKALAALNPHTPEPSGDREINAAGLALVKHFEGLYLEAYQDPVGVWTVGFGHTGLKHEDGTVYRGRKITEAEADMLLMLDMAVFEERVTELSKVELNDNEFAALVSFDFNTGALEQSTLLLLLNQEHKRDAAEQFLRWNKAHVNGRVVVLNGLTKRRVAERALFLSVVSDAAKWSTTEPLSERERAEARTEPVNPDIQLE